MRFFIILFFSAFYLFGSAQNKTVWWKLADSNYSIIGGQGWPGDKRDSIQRYPNRFKSLVSNSVWYRSRQSAGLSIRFVSNAQQLIIRYKVSSSTAISTMFETAVSGVDLYAIDSDGLWHWATARFTIKDSVEYIFDHLRPNDNFHKLGREYQLFLPLFNAADDLQIGVPEGSLFSPLPRRVEKPIVVYGSSLVQGQGATRPGMAWTNILTRKLDREVINLGFSGNGLIEKGTAELISEIDARIFVFDGMVDIVNLPIDSNVLRRSIIESVKTIRKTHPQTPILLTEHAGYTDGYLISDKQSSFENANKLLNSVISQLKAENISGIHLLTNNEIGIDMDEMNDGEHPNDLGMMRYANAYDKKLREIFMEPVGKLKTQIPIRQRRTPANYDWEGRHRMVLSLNKTESSKVLLIGNSITHNWGGKPNTKSNNSWEKYIAPYKVRNFGFGADRIENVLWRVYHDELSDIRPEKILINIGTNNLRVNNNEDIVEGLRFLVQAIKLHQPQSEITILGIYPRRGYDDRILLINKQLHMIAKSENVKFSDIGKILSLKGGIINEAYFSDGLHPNLKGYEALGKELEVLLKK